MRNRIPSIVVYILEDQSFQISFLIQFETAEPCVLSLKSNKNNDKMSSDQFLI